MQSRKMNKEHRYIFEKGSKKHNCPECDKKRYVMYVDIETKEYLRHVLPNSLTPALIQSSVTIGFAILLTAGLSFVGAGVRPPTPEWGLMISTGANQIVLGEWWPSVFPGLAISLTVFGFAVLGNSLERRYEQG